VGLPIPLRTGTSADQAHSACDRYGRFRIRTGCGATRCSRWWVSLLRLLCAIMLVSELGISAAIRSVPHEPFRPDRILVQPKDGTTGSLAELHTKHRVAVLKKFSGMGGLEVLRVPPAQTVLALLSAYRQSGLVAYAEPDHWVHAAVNAPNDPRFAD